MDQLQETTAVPDTKAAGPLDRTSFFDEQRRRRRQTWRFTALCAVAAALAGVPLAIFITPFLFLAAIVGLRAAERFTPVPVQLWTTMRELSLVVPSFLDGFSAAPESKLLPSLRAGLNAVSFPFDSPLLTIALLLVPSMLAVVVVWLAYRALFRKAGVGGELLALGAREPRLDDLEERQLVNLIHEMAIASGLPPPQVRLLDSPVPNAAAVGSSIHDAVIIVSRGLLDRLNRDDTQGVIAHLIGSVGNGDMRIALSITTLFQAIELFFTAFDALINWSRSAWRDLFALVRCAWRGGSDPRAATALAGLMEHRLAELRDDGMVGLMEDAQRDRPQTWFGKLIKRLPFLYIVILPFALLYIPFMLLKFQVFLFRLMIIGPMVMMVWRTRRYLADATAVQLTRNPDGVARGLLRLAAESAVVPGGQWLSHLFVVGPEAMAARKQSAFQQRLAGLRERQPTVGTVATSTDAYRASQQHAEDLHQSTKGTWSQELGGIASHPPLTKRLKRLDALGARLASAGAKAKASRASRGGRLLQLGFAIVIVPLVVLMIYLLLCVMAMVFLFAIVSATFFIGVAMLVIHRLLL